MSAAAADRLHGKTFEGCFKIVMHLMLEAAPIPRGWYPYRLGAVRFDIGEGLIWFEIKSPGLHVILWTQKPDGEQLEFKKGGAPELRSLAIRALEKLDELGIDLPTEGAPS